MHVWKTRKVFISSTFKDLELERDQMAQIFQELKERIFSRRLHLIPYDLRWREQNEENLVKWCLEMVEECHYFVGIIGARYGWRPPYNEKGEPNVDSLSITEMEIHKALEVIPRERRFFCFSQTIEEASSTQTSEDQASLKKLQVDLESQGEKIFFYENRADVLQIVRGEMIIVLDREYPPGNKVDLESYTRREALQEMIEEKRRGFVGQAQYLEKMKNFAQGEEEQNYLAIHAVAGTGKSALLAQFIHNWEEEHPDIPLVAHYMSMAGDSSSVLGLMQSMGEQLQRHDLITEELEVLPERLLSQVRGVLQSATQKLIIALDGIDEMQEEGHSLSWLPRWLPANVRIIITTRPVSPWPELKNFPSLQAIFLSPLEENYIREIIQHYQKQHELDITPHDEDILAQRSAGNPLFLKVALDELVAGGVAVGQLAETVEALFRQILQRLQNRYGENLISSYLGLIASSRSGLTEGELREILAHDFPEKASDDFLLLVNNSLANFIVPREKLLNFFHPEFERSVKMLLGRNQMRGFHHRLSHYFGKKGYLYERSLSELVYQLQWAEEYSKVLETLADIHFLEAKSQAAMLTDLRYDFEFSLKNIAVPLPRDLKVEVAQGVFSSSSILELLARMLDFEYHFLMRHPESIFQCLWNRGYWHDAPEAREHYEEGEWTEDGEKLYLLMEKWRQEKKSSEPWLRSLRPLPERLDSPMLKIFRGHKDIVTSVFLDPSEEWLVSGSWDNTVRLWETKSGQSLLILKGHEDFISSVSLSQDRSLIVSGSGDGTVRVWNAQTGQVLHILKGHEKAVACVALSADGKRVVSASKDKNVCLWDIQNGECLFTLTGHKKTVHGIAINADGSRIASGSWDNTARIWNGLTGELLHELTDHKDDVRAMSFSLDGKKVFSGSKDHTARMWDTQTGQCEQIFTHRSAVFSVSSNQDGSKIATGVYGTIRIWDTASGTCSLKFDGHESAIFGIYLNAEGTRVASASSDKTIRIWDVESDRAWRNLKAHEDDIRCISTTPGGAQIATASKDSTIRIWNAQKGQPQATLSEHQDKVMSVHISKNGQRLVTGSSDKTIRIWDLATKENICTLSGSNKIITTVCLSDDGSKVVSGGRDSLVRLWDIQTKECLLTLEGHQDDIRWVCLSSDKSLILSGGEDKTVRLWDVQSGQCLHIFEGHQAGITNLGISPDKNTIFSSARDNTVRQWNRESGECLKILSGFGDIQQLFLPHLRHYALSSELETVLYDRKTDEAVGFFPSIIRQVMYTGQGMVVGFGGVHLYILRWEGGR